MRKLAEVVSYELKWSQPSMARREYQLTASGERIGGLGFRSMFGTHATTQGADGSLTFKRVGFWQQKATARAQGSETDLAVFTNNTWSNGGTLRFASGAEFRATSNIWQTRFAFLDASEQPLVTFHLSGVLHLSSRVEVHAAARSLPQLALLVYFGWYLAVMLHSDSAGASAAASAG